MKNTSKIALDEASGPITDLLQKLSGENGSAWLEILKTTLRRNMYPSLVKNFREFFSVEVRDFTTVEALYEAAVENFPYARQRNKDGILKLIFLSEVKKFELVEAYVAELGFYKGTTYENLCKRIKELDYDLCREADALYVASEKKGGGRFQDCFVCEKNTVFYLSGDGPASGNQITYNDHLTYDFAYNQKVVFRKKK